MKKILSYFLVGALVFSSCETEVDPDLANTLNILVVDAWLTNNDPIQQINITRSQSFFDASAPQKVAGATVTITDLTDNSQPVYEFTEQAERYTWQSGDGSGLGIIGHDYELRVEVAGEIYTATTTLNDVPPIDSLTFRLEEGNAFFDDLILAELFATDLEGVNDTYWIKTWKNGRFLGKPSEINIAFDAAFSASSENDGVQFIQPIREGINPAEVNLAGDFLSPYNLPDTFAVNGNVILNEDESVYGIIMNDSIIFQEANVPDDFSAVSLDDPQYNLTDQNTLIVNGDSIYVEILSISNEAYFFLNQVIIETNRPGGFGALFATPLANVSTNIIPVNEDNSVAGFFNIAAVSGTGTRLRNEDQVRISR